MNASTVRGALVHPGESREETVRRVKTEAAQQVCPCCAKQQAVPVFREPYSPQMIEDLRQDYGPDGFVLGGCWVSENSWYCNACGYWFADESGII